MKLYCVSLFLITFLNIQAQEISTQHKYNTVVVDFIRSRVFVCFPLWVQDKNRSTFRVLTSNYGLFGCYYSKSLNYPVEFADTVEDILNFEFVGLQLDKCPKLKENAIDNSLYKKLENKGIKKTINKYFDTFGNENKDRFFKVKRKYLSSKSILTILCFMCDNYYVITSNGDGFYVAHLLD